MVDSTGGGNYGGWSSGTGGENTGTKGVGGDPINGGNGGKSSPGGGGDNIGRKGVGVSSSTGGKSCCGGGLNKGNGGDSVNSSGGKFGWSVLGGEILGMVSTHYLVMGYLVLLVGQILELMVVLV